MFPFKDIVAFEKSAQKPLRADRVRLYCRYPKDIFGMDYYDTIVKLLKRRSFGSKRFLDDAEVSLDGNKYKVLCMADKIFFKMHSVKMIFTELIYNQFGVM